MNADQMPLELRVHDPKEWRCIHPTGEFTYPFSEFKLIGIEPSKYKNRKYDAIIDSGPNSRWQPSLLRIPFGEEDQPHYKDTTGLGLHSHMDHDDLGRRLLFCKEAEKKLYLSEHYSHTYFTLKYLYSWDIDEDNLYKFDYGKDRPLTPEELARFDERIKHLLVPRLVREASNI